ncbi:ras family domain-containing protein [Ditylenchus destructor]|uniref:Ras family domain-containing protein n=1 Tax=Ditylenchus destructor TaxID=166010 RepID=A0AAD4R561_9BILA|nr:ras family domain-containing protein [Ditylenchus destructor]
MFIVSVQIVGLHFLDLEYSGKKAALNPMSFNDSPSRPISHKRECLFKIIVIGDISTGKTSLIQRYVHDIINQHYKPTLGVDFATKLVQCDDTLVRLQFWDISGTWMWIRE